MTLEELALKHEGGDEWDYAFTKDQLRALITEALEIVQGEVVGSINDMGAAPLHYNDITRLK